MKSKSHKQILNTIKDQHLLGGIALDVFEIFCDNDGATAGEVFLAYKKLFPNTSRSRNEIAKRVSDLVNWGVIRRQGSAICPMTHKNVSCYVVTGSLPNKQGALPAVRGSLALVQEREVSLEAISARSMNVAVLSALAGRARFLLRFRRILGSQLLVKTEQTLIALEYAIEQLETKNA